MWSGIPKSFRVNPFTAASHPDYRPRLFAATIQQLTMVPCLAGDVLRSHVARRHVDPGVGVGATKGLSGCRWKVQVVWMLEVKLATMQIDAVITDVTSEESANPGCEEESVLVDSYEVVGIYFGRR